mmetsp:Transcript_71527/g.190762  ORF Transcript_71527/g.190762 Transcript_71527/m.190762 type:complete len:203 (-) Transcript_71527:3477-4085(-)
MHVHPVAPVPEQRTHVQALRLRQTQRCTGRGIQPLVIPVAKTPGSGASVAALLVALVLHGPRVPLPGPVHVVPVTEHPLDPVHRHRHPPDLRRVLRGVERRQRRERRGLHHRRRRRRPAAGLVAIHDEDPVLEDVQAGARDLDGLEGPGGGVQDVLLPGVRAGGDGEGPDLVGEVGGARAGVRGEALVHRAQAQAVGPGVRG